MCYTEPMLKDTLISHSPERLGAYPDDPQLLGLIDESARVDALRDPRTITAEVKGRLEPIMVPIEYATEANQAFFADKQPAFFYNWVELLGDMALQQQVFDQHLALMPSGARIMLETRGGDQKIVEVLSEVAASRGRSVTIDPDVYDEENGTLASVAHYLSRFHIEEKPDATFSNLGDAYDYLEQRGLWEPYAQQGIRFSSGEAMGKDTLAKLWDVYDKTFDKLVENHPSAQKQPKEYFEEQTTAPGSYITYIENDDRIVSALFLVDDVAKCPWLNPRFFERQNPDGTTLFISGISTSLDMKGMGFSEQTIKAMSEMARRVPALVACATQCTNRSMTYIPPLSNKFTAGNVNLDFQDPTAVYEYPVVTIE